MQNTAPMSTSVACRIPQLGALIHHQSQDESPDGSLDGSPKECHRESPKIDRSRQQGRRKGAWISLDDGYRSSRSRRRIVWDINGSSGFFFDIQQEETLICTKILKNPMKVSSQSEASFPSPLLLPLPRKESCGIQPVH